MCTLVWNIDLDCEHHPKQEKKKKQKTHLYREKIMRGSRFVFHMNQLVTCLLPNVDGFHRYFYARIDEEHDDGHLPFLWVSMLTWVKLDFSHVPEGAWVDEKTGEITRLLVSRELLRAIDEINEEQQVRQSCSWPARLDEQVRGRFDDGDTFFWGEIVMPTRHMRPGYYPVRILGLYSFSRELEGKKFPDRPFVIKQEEHVVRIYKGKRDLFPVSSVIPSFVDAYQANFKGIFDIIRDTVSHTKGQQEFWTHETSVYLRMSNERDPKDIFDLLPETLKLVRSVNLPTLVAPREVVFVRPTKKLPLFIRAARWPGFDAFYKYVMTRGEDKTWQSLPHDNSFFRLIIGDDACGAARDFALTYLW